jgi:hypothetical protein
MANRKFTQAQMSQCFDNVKNAENWKDPINKTIANPGMQNLMCLAEAIVHFTGSFAHIKLLPNGKVRVTAPGYYATENDVLSGLGF